MNTPQGLSPTEQIVYQYFRELINENAAIAGLALYLAATLAVLYVTIRTRTWYMLVVPLTGSLEAIGYAARYGMLHKPTYGLYIIMACCLIISPVLLAIVNYLTVGRLINRSEAGKGTRLARWLATLFTASDLLCLSLQGAGGGMLVSTDLNTVNMGRMVLMIGLAAQLVFFTIFTCITIRVQISPKYGYAGPDWHMWKVFLCLHLTIILMYVRNIYRVVEFATGFDGYVNTHEKFFYGLDFAPIFSCFICYTVLHFGWFLGPSSGPVTPSTTPHKDSTWSQSKVLPSVEQLV